MIAFEVLLALVLAAVVLAALARRIGAPYPAFLALGGAILAFIPGVPILSVPPDLALALFVAPVLLDAAFDASPRDLRDNWIPVTSLAVIAVGLTTIVVAVVVRSLVHEIPWPAAIALGAVVAPPDAAAATAVLRQLRPPHRLLTILEGESLFNDAIALLIYRLAVGATLAGSFSLLSIAPTFLLAVTGSLIAGLLFAWLTLSVMRRVEDASTAILIQFITTFGVWIIADRIGLSGVLTMVTYAITAARSAPEWMPARLRIPSYAVWDTVVFMMNVLAFIFIGLQMRPILDSLAPAVRSHYLLVAGAIVATVILVRLAWHMSFNAVIRWRDRRHGFNPPRPMLRPTVGSGLVISWSGMRGIVTLAAALALPRGFPFSDLIVLTAFAVVLGTLVVQGLTLKPLLLALDLHDGDPVAQEVEAARKRALDAALGTFAEDASPMAEAVRHEFTAHLGSRSEDREDDLARRASHSDLHRRALAAARDTALAMRVADEIGDDAFHQLEEEFDWIEMADRAADEAEAD